VREVIIGAFFCGRVYEYTDLARRHLGEVELQRARVVDVWVGGEADSGSGGDAHGRDASFS